MADIFILQNQEKLFYGKNKEWVDGYDAAALFKSPHKDEAINLMVEITAKDYAQRIKVLSCTTDYKGLPMIDSAHMPVPTAQKLAQPEPGEDMFASIDEAISEVDLDAHHAANDDFNFDGADQAETETQLA